MYLTDVFRNEGSEAFDWENYFSTEHFNDIIHQVNPVQIVSKLREHLKEDRFRLTFSLTRLMRGLLKDIQPDSPSILELGAATGFLTRWLISRYRGRGVLVDKSMASYLAYSSMQDDLKKHITYLNMDLFDLELEERFDLVCSFGLIEHFKNKAPVLAVHKKFTSATGKILILVPLDSPLTRAFLEVHPELNLGYRELLSEKEFKHILTRNGLQVVRTTISQGYCYDFAGALCTCSKTRSYQ